MLLREKAGTVVSGSALAGELGISRVAVWKGIQTLTAGGYSIETQGSGYMLNSEKANDFLYPWEFGEKEAMFHHFTNTSSTMDKARELAARELPAGSVITAEKQSAGRGRKGSTWASRPGGLFCTVLDRPTLALFDYCQSLMLYQIAIGRALHSVCRKQARLRWPNDIYIDGRKIAGLLTELAGEADSIAWIATGFGVNVNNKTLSGKAVSCAEIAGHSLSRRELLLKILDEFELARKRTSPGTAYSQGNRLLADEWNSLADGIGAQAAAVASGVVSSETQPRILARGTFAGIDPAGRCIIKPENGKGNFYFNPGPVSVVFLGGIQN